MDTIYTPPPHTNSFATLISSFLGGGFRIYSSFKSNSDSGSFSTHHCNEQTFAFQGNGVPMALGGEMNALGSAPQLNGGRNTAGGYSISVDSSYFPFNFLCTTFAEFIIPLYLQIRCSPIPICPRVLAPRDCCVWGRSGDWRIGIR